MKQHQNKLNDETRNIKEQLVEQKNINNVLENKIDDLTNRGLRSTLVIRGVSDEGEQDDWDKTEAKLVKVLAANIGKPEKEVENMIERAHRTKEARYRGKGVRPIFVLFHNWKYCKQLMEFDLQNGVEENVKKIFID